MTTYKTYHSYEEAKISNPENDIYTIDDVFFAVNLRNSARCKPEEECMTVEHFLNEGLIFAEGDLILDCGTVFCVTKTPPLIGNCFTVESSNTIDICDNERYVLRAAALEEKKPRTRVEYVQVLDCIFNLKSDYENGNLYHSYDGKEFSEIKGDERTVARCLVECNLYRRIETPITWKEELYNYLDNSCEMSDDFDDSFTIEIEGRPLEFNLNDDEFVDMCKLVASLNSVN